MELILIVLTGVLTGALLVGAYFLGYKAGSEKETREGVAVTEQNAELIKEMLEWKNYGGK